MVPDSRKHCYLPFPELVEPHAAGAGTPYAIVDSRELSGGEMAGAVDKVSRVMSVPLEPEGRPVCRHEAGHVRWSPRRPARVSFDARVLAAVEDARVNLALHAARLPVELGECGDLRVAWLLARDAKRGDGFALFMRGVASVGTSAEPILADQLARLARHDAELALAAMRHTRAQLERARLRAGGEVAPERRARALARELARTLGALGLLDANAMASSPIVLDCSRTHVAARAAAGKGSTGRGADVPEVEPGRMRIARARLTRTLPFSRGMRAWGASAEGSVVRYPHRWASDRAIFRRRVARARGTVLIDVSGSMSLEEQDLELLLARTGRGIRVAIYSGDGDAGELRIVADGSRRAEGAALARFGRGNIVDLPALRWLAHQPGPRLWISDGRATGVGDKGSARLRERCRLLCRRAGIRRVEDIDEATRALAGGAALRA